MNLDAKLQDRLPPHYQPFVPLFAHYLTLLAHWNKTYNLTAIRDFDAMISLHILDCLGIFPYLKGPRILDVGSGAGLPGIPIAICYKNFEITLVESNRKRVQFLETVKHELRLQHLSIWQGRIEHYQPGFRFDTITSRAFSDLAQFVHLSQKLCADNGQWCAMKGQVPHQELQNLRIPYQVHPYQIPGENVARCCVIMTHKD